MVGAAAVIVACGASSPPPTSRADAPTSRGKQCLLDAAAPRTPKPDAAAKIGVSQILVRHAELERPLGATRAREAACLRALEARQKLEAGADFAEVVAQYSDGGKDTGGVLGRVSRDELDPKFADAAFALDVNELSYVVETPRGFHVILRTE